MKPGQLKRSRPLRRQSKTRAAKAVAFRDVKMEVRARSNGWCEIPDCGRRADHPHHIWPQGNGGPDEVDNILDVCWIHHRRIHDEPWWSKPLGYLR